MGTEGHCCGSAEEGAEFDLSRTEDLGTVMFLYLIMVKWLQLHVYISDPFVLRFISIPFLRLLLSWMMTLFWLQLKRLLTALFS